jgi:trimeric autotransporter adhesin
MAIINVQANVKTNSGYDIINLNNSGRNTDSSVGYGSSAEGYDTSAGGLRAHAEGNTTQANGDYSHAEGYGTQANGNYSHAGGYGTNASGLKAHAEGNTTIASGEDSHAEGCGTNASGLKAHAEGNYTTALANQHAQGHYNNTTLAIANSVSGTSNGTAFVIGNGTSEGTSNAFRVTGEGVTYSKGAYNTTGADYAEYFEWKDENPNSEERYGYFVTLDGDKIVKAKENDYILGIVSKYPSIIGNSDEHWRGQYEMDDFGAYILETKEETYKEIEYDEEMNPQEVEKTREITFYKVNKDYDPNFEYIPRAKRKEWNAIGMLGVLSVYDDGTCEVNGYCKCNDDGIATKCERGFDSYRVIERVTSNIVKVIFR